jgi:predicted GIY-YIG superfamily endonuclease
MQAGGRYAVYVMASRRNGALCVGVTNNLAVRAHQHRTGKGSEFTRKYGVTRLVWYEFHSDVNEAIARSGSRNGSAGGNWSNLSVGKIRNLCYTIGLAPLKFSERRTMKGDGAAA